jgi:hypothetical protein
VAYRFDRAQGLLMLLGRETIAWSAQAAPLQLLATY